jgi:hypothetical protein
MPTTVYQRTAMAAAIAACFPFASSAAPVAFVDFATGSVSAIAPDGRSRALSKGSEVELGETVATGQGRAQLRFLDGAYMSLQPQTEFKVEEFRYSGRAGASEDNIVMNLLKGGLRTITGLIGRTNRNAYRLKTEVATIGIRGTEYSVKYTNSIEVFCADGAVSVDNQAGSFTVPGGSGVLVNNQQTPPQQTDQKPVLPPESPVFEEEKQLTEQVPPPVNPIQESQQGSALLTGTHTGNWAVVHPGQHASGVDQTIVLDSSGILTNYDTTGIGTSTGTSDGNDGLIAWGRWAGGATTSGLNTASSELHYVVGIAATMPTTGTATYSMLGATPPTVSGGSLVSVTSSMLKVDFGLSSGQFHTTWSINGGAVQTPVSGIGFGVSGATMTGSGSWNIGACDFYSISLKGVFVGDNAARAGMTYILNFSAASSGTAHGAIAYTNTGP